MPVKEILLLRHGHRLAWTLDPTTGRYTSNHPFPTRLPADPPLASHGVRQAEETGAYLSQVLADAAAQDRLRIYSSLFYRCLETLRPTVEQLRKKITSKADSYDKILRNLEVRGERGIGEWFGKAWFEQPVPAEPAVLREDFFPWLDIHYKSRVVPDRHGERIEVIHDRIARALAAVVRAVDKEYEEAGRAKEEVTLLLCGHAAQIICTGRALTGLVPEDYDEEDFHCYTCGISRFVRRGKGTAETDRDWRTSGGVAGGWDCVENSACRHLSEGAERGWHFHGDESFDSYGAAMNMGIKTSDGGVKEKVEDTNESASKL